MRRRSQSSRTWLYCGFLDAEAKLTLVSKCLWLVEHTGLTQKISHFQQSPWEELNILTSKVYKVSLCPREVQLIIDFGYRPPTHSKFPKFFLKSLSERERARKLLERVLKSHMTQFQCLRAYQKMSSLTFLQVHFLAFPLVPSLLGDNALASIAVLKVQGGNSFKFRF